MLRMLQLSSDSQTVATPRPGSVLRELPPPSASSSGPRRACNLFPLPGATRVEHEQASANDSSGPHSSSPYRRGSIIAGKYCLLSQLGRGGMGEVWSAEHLTLNTKVAVKFLSMGATGAAARIALERFRFEAQVSAQLGQRTSHVVAVHDADSDISGPFLVMEHVPGRTLRAELTRKGQLDLATVADIVDQMTEALSVAHGLGIIHRDLKPSNLLLVERPDGSFHVKVADFGIAKALRAELDVDRPDDTSDGWMLGSPPYMSPEQMLGGGTVDAHTDMWATAVIVYEALTGRLPFPGRVAAEIIVNIANGGFEAPSRFRPSLPPEVDHWFRRALAHNGCDRFASMEELARELRIAVSARRSRFLPRVVRSSVMALSLAAALISLRPSPAGDVPAMIAATEPVAAASEATPDTAGLTSAERVVEAAAAGPTTNAEVLTSHRSSLLPGTTARHVSSHSVAEAPARKGAALTPAAGARGAQAKSAARRPALTEAF